MRHMINLNFDEVYELMLRRHWRFSGAQNTIEVLAKFGNDTGLLNVDFDQQVVYWTDLAINPDDRTAANMLIANFSQMPDRDNPHVFMGGEATTVNGLIEELRQLTPLGLRLVELHKGATERVRKVKASRRLASNQT